MKSASDAVPARPGDPAATVGKRRLRQIPEAEAGWWAAVQAHGPNHPSLVSTAAIAEAVGRSPATVRWWRWRGTFPAPVIVGGRLRHLRGDVQRWAIERSLAAEHRRRPAAASIRPHAAGPSPAASMPPPLKGACSRDGAQ